MHARILGLLLLVLATGHAQEAVSVGSFQLPPGEGGYFGAAAFRNQPPTFTLTPKSPEARNGKIWVRNAGGGLLIVGKVDGPAPDWAAERAALLANDHVEVWITAAPKVDLPPIGWGNQFGPVELQSAQDCLKGAAGSESGHVAECQSWYSKQMQYRSLLERLFVRQFVFTYGNTVEEFASPAYLALASNFFSDYVPAALEPKRTGLPRMQPSIGPSFRIAYPNETGYEFQIYIPYEAFPPVRQLALKDLWVMVNVFNSAQPGKKQGAYSTSAPNGEWGKPSTFNHIGLDPPRPFALTPCDVQLAENDLYGKEYAGWFFPQQSRTLSAQTSRFKTTKPDISIGQPRPRPLSILSNISGRGLAAAVMCVDRN